ncbi:hypothetical protein J7I88_05155 [Paraburkholderia strydomiana]|nr:hypothetical protein [Paraburkholderia strydomiana]
MITAVATYASQTVQCKQAPPRPARHEQEPRREVSLSIPKHDNGTALRCYFLPKDCCIVIEAATEDAALKGRILRHIETIVRLDVIIGSNTSSISTTALGDTLRIPGRFIGMHFFNPVPLMPPVEPIRGIHTSEATSASVRHLTALLGKTTIGEKTRLARCSRNEHALTRDLHYRGRPARE